MEDFPDFREWKGTARRFYNTATEYKLLFVEFPAWPDPPGALIKNYPRVDFVKVGYPLPPGAKVFDFDDVFGNEEAMNLLMSWAVRLYFPEDE
jgi:hypothetical protein